MVFSEAGLSDEERKMFENGSYKTGKGTVQIKFNQEIPTKIIEQTLEAHSKINKRMALM